MIITKIQRLRGKKPRYTVLLENAPSLELSDWIIGKYGLRTGDDLEQSELEKIQSAEAQYRAKGVAINYLSYRQRSSKEVADHLLKKGFSRECAVNVTEQLRASELINDKKFSEAFIKDRLQRKPIGALLLRQQLIAKGISSKEIEPILAQSITEKKQYESACLAAKHKLRLIHANKKQLDNNATKKRVLDFLLRRGFSYEIASTTIRQLGT